MVVFECFVTVLNCVAMRCIVLQCVAVCQYGCVCVCAT